ncbi:hypothetical protein [Nonomuraea glycinis]|uniref:hypothetical protein n=1 Tax=Nonomuraea glycinis TaxID=2047744 RepID=UPI0033B5F9B5
MATLVDLVIGDAGVHGRPGGKATWGPPAHAALRRLIADRSRSHTFAPDPIVLGMLGSTAIREEEIIVL